MNNNYNNTYQKSENIVIKNMYAPEYSYLMMSFYKRNLSLRFAPYIGKSNQDRSQYDTSNMLSTTIDNESAAAFYSMVMEILNGRETPVKMTLPCNNDTSLVFTYEQDENGEMGACLAIQKNGETIPFKFEIHQYCVKENGQILTKTIQSGLLVFAKVLEAYLMTKDCDKYLDKIQQNHNTYSKQSTEW